MEFSRLTEDNLQGALGGWCGQRRMMKPFPEMNCRRRGIVGSGEDRRERMSSAQGMLVQSAWAFKPEIQETGLH